MTPNLSPASVPDELNGRVSQGRAAGKVLLASAEIQDRSAAHKGPLKYDNGHKGDCLDSESVRRKRPEAGWNKRTRVWRTRCTAEVRKDIPGREHRPSSPLGSGESQQPERPISWIPPGCWAGRAFISASARMASEEESCLGLGLKACTWIGRKLSLERRAGVCLASATILASIYMIAAFFGYTASPPSLRPSLDGGWAGEESGSPWAKFQVKNAGLLLAAVLSCCFSYLTAGAYNASSVRMGRKFSAMLLICCVLGSELPSAEALSRPVVVDSDILARTVLAMDGATVEESENTLLSNDSSSRVGRPTDLSGLGAGRHLLADLGHAPSQITTELLESPFTDADQSPTVPADYAKQEGKIEKLDKNMERRLRDSSKHETKIEVTIKKLDDMITEDLTDVAQSVQETNKKLSDEIVEVPGVVGAPGPPGDNGKMGKAGINGERECLPCGPFRACAQS
jgi:hypothetical protein